MATTYVLDTSVLLADPGALEKFEEHEVVIPIVVISELEAKRDHPELGYFARAALRTLDDLRLSHGRLDKPLTLNDLGGKLTVELNHSDTSSLPSSFLRDSNNDTRILTVAKNLMSEGRHVVLVSKDLPLRVKASSLGIEAEEYRAEIVSSSGWTGIEELDVGHQIIDELYSSDFVEHEAAHTLPVHTGIVLHSEREARLLESHRISGCNWSEGIEMHLGSMVDLQSNESPWISYLMNRLESSHSEAGQEQVSQRWLSAPDSRQ